MTDSKSSDSQLPSLMIFPMTHSAHDDGDGDGDGDCDGVASSIIFLEGFIANRELDNIEDDDFDDHVHFDNVQCCQCVQCVEMRNYVNDGIDINLLRDNPSRMYRITTIPSFDFINNVDVD
jgi:predicted molibdopterin-dependent oxidoreductase YjgC